MRKNIVLIGLMGCGKSTIGRLLSQNLDMDFIDVDWLIEKEAGMNINMIFERHGEAYFREIESNVVKKVSSGSNQVISTGGGVVERPDNLDFLKENGILFYLYAPAQELYNRIKNDTNRPLLKNDDPFGTLKKLLARREGLYKQANVEINTVNKTFDKIVSEIIENYEY